MGDQARCWCGSTDLTAFSPDYLMCGDCGTLVAVAMPGREITRVEDEEEDFYGRRYWFEYQERELGNPDITVRARADLPERCVYWLRTVLGYRLPPGRAVDVGSGHGALVLLLARAGFEATGLELSPWVVDFAHRTFGVPVLRGSLEEQLLEPRSVDVVTMMDVLEHLAEPLATVSSALTALREDGLLVIQTPAVPPNLSWEAMVAADHPFLPLMRERGHLFLFGEAALRRLLARLGVDYVNFEPACFEAYDMFVVASRRPLTPTAPAALAATLAVTPESRLVQALLDLDDRRRDLQARYTEVERDRVARLAALQTQGAELKAAEGERNALRAEREDFKGYLAASEADRAARLVVIHERSARLAEQNGRLDAREQDLTELRRHLDEIEADRAARLVVIEELGSRLAAAEADRAARLVVIEEQASRLAAAEGDRAAQLAIIHQQAGQLDVVVAERDTLRARAQSTIARRATRWARALAARLRGRR